MVEAVIVVSVLVIFFGLADYIRASYVEKITEQDRTRREALDYASHNCEGTTGFAEGISKSGNIDTAINAGGAGEANDTLSSNSGAQNKSSGVMAKASSRTSGKAKGGGRERDIHSESWVLCNEKPFEGGLGGFAGYVKGKATF